MLLDLGGVLVEFTGPSTMLRWLGDRLTPEQIWPMWLGSSVVREFETGRVILIKEPKPPRPAGPSRRSPRG